MRGLILAADGVEDWELMYPYYRLQEEGGDVDVAAPEAGPLKGLHNCYPLKANLSFFEMWGADYYDALVLPGGTCQEAVRLNSEALQIVRDMDEADKVLAAVGHGIETLVSAEVIKGKRAACAAGVRDELRIAGAEYVDAAVVVDGNLVTSRGTPDLPAFCREVIHALKQR